MASGKKTIPVEQVRSMINELLRNTIDNARNGTRTMTAQEWRAFREGAASIAESVLHSTGNYRGFNYINGWDETDLACKTDRHYH